mgnify:CR=1 FL=1
MDRFDYLLYPHLCDDDKVWVLLIPIIREMVAVLGIEYVCGLLHEGDYPLLAHLSSA